MINSSNKKPNFIILLLIIIVAVIITALVFSKISHKNNSNVPTPEINTVIPNVSNNTAPTTTNSGTQSEEKTITSYLISYEMLSKHPVSEVKSEIKNNESLLENSIVKENLSKYAQDLNNECNKIVLGGKPILLTKYQLYLNYVQAKEITNKNEFNMFSNLLNGKCENFEKEEKEMCNIYKTKDLLKLESLKSSQDYNYYFFKSLIDGKDQCISIKDKSESEDCTKSFQEFIDIKNTKVDDTNIINNSLVDNGKLLNSIGKDKYLNLVNTQFINECSKIDFK